VTWAPDGKRIAFNQSGNIFIVNKDGSNKTKLTQFTSGSIEAIAWCQDGKRIAFSHERALHIINADGSGLRKITEGLGVRKICWVPKNSE
jgi:Tol biopolymer transport system component